MNMSPNATYDAEAPLGVERTLRPDNPLTRIGVGGRRNSNENVRTNCFLLSAIRFPRQDFFAAKCMPDLWNSNGDSSRGQEMEIPAVCL